jgi:hypothetical protein
MLPMPFAKKQSPTLPVEKLYIGPNDFGINVTIMKYHPKETLMGIQHNITSGSKRNLKLPNFIE